MRVAEQPAGAAGDWRGGLGRDVLGREQVGVPSHRADDQVFEAAFARVGGHASTGSSVFAFGLVRPRSASISSSGSGSSASSGSCAAHLAHVELAGDNIRDQASAVLAKQLDLIAARAVDAAVDLRSRDLSELQIASCSLRGGSGTRQMASDVSLIVEP